MNDMESKDHGGGFNPYTDNGIVVFEATLAKELTQQRFPTGYLGVRRLRPSSQQISKVAFGDKNRSSGTAFPPPVYKILDSVTGEERRMTSKEKKKHKKQYEKRKRAHRQLEIDEQQQQEPTAVVCDNSSTSNALQEGYVKLGIDAKSLEEELADLRGEREGVPPVIIPSPLARLALSSVLGIDTPKLNVLLDDQWAKEWSLELKKSMKLAEDVRNKEDMRPMPYHLVPEVWQRMRPEGLGSQGSEKQHQGRANQKNNDWTFMDVHHSLRDDSVAAVIQILHQGTNLHIACGAKFGCEYLLYDGPRSERHAFAGIRFCQSTDAYDLSGYVRCLNTAGKLALLAATKKEVDSFGDVLYRVAFVDLALVKIVETTFKKPKKTMEQRLKNLNKKS